MDSKRTILKGLINPIAKYTYFILVMLLVGLFGYAAGVYSQSTDNGTKTTRSTATPDKDSKLKDVSPVTTDSISPATAPADETADWKTYENSKYGFSFKYPADDILSDNKINNQSSEFNVVLRTPSEQKNVSSPGTTDYSAGINIVIIKNSEKTFSEFITKTESYENFKATDKALGTVTAKYIEGAGLAEGTFNNYIELPNSESNILDIYFTHKNDLVDPINNKILSTFKFTN